MLMIGIIFKPLFCLGPVGPVVHNGNGWDFESPMQAKQHNSMIDRIFGVERRVEDGF